MSFQGAEFFAGLKPIGSSLGGFGMGCGLLVLLRSLVHMYRPWDIGLGFTLGHRRRLFEGLLRLGKRIFGAELGCRR